MAWIKLTHNVADKAGGTQKKFVYVNVDQICRVGDPVGAGAGYLANVLLANGQVDVFESVDQVMGFIKSPNA